MWRPLNNLLASLTGVLRQTDSNRLASYARDVWYADRFSTPPHRLPKAILHNRRAESFLRICDTLWSNIWLKLHQCCCFTVTIIFQMGSLVSPAQMPSLLPNREGRPVTSNCSNSGLFLLFFFHLFQQGVSPIRQIENCIPKPFIQAQPGVEHPFRPYVMLVLSTWATL